jgi:hypothetical protein
MITGVTKDGAGTPVGSANVDIYSKASRRWWGTAVSDANGNYSIEVSAPSALEPDGQTLTFFAVAYKAGGPDISGTTVNTLVGA